MKKKYTENKLLALAHQLLFSVGELSLNLSSWIHKLATAQVANYLCVFFCIDPMTMDETS
jgi:hypothetical protein